MLNLFVKRALCLLIMGLPSFMLCAQTVDTTRYYPIQTVEVVAKSIVVPSNSSVLLQQMNKSQIEQLGLENLSDAVKHFSGVSVKDYGGIGGLKTVSIRSLGAYHTAVSYDGMTVNDASGGQTDISRFSLDDVEMLSLSIGQSDDIFQSARIYASAGALTIHTQKPVFKTRPYNFMFKLKGGSFGLLNPVLRYERRLSNRWAATAHAEWLSAKGDYPFTLVNGKEVTHETRYNSDIQAYRLEGNLSGYTGKTGVFNAKVYYYDSNRALPGAVIYYNNHNAHERLWNNEFFTQMHFESSWSNTLKFRIGAKYNYSFSRYRDVSARYSSGKQIDLNTQNEGYTTAGWLWTPFKKISLTYNQDVAYNTLVNNFADSPKPKRWTYLGAVALQYKTDWLTATASTLGTYVTNKVSAGDCPKDLKRLSPAASLSIRPIASLPALRFRTSFKQSFRVPTFTDLYYLRMGNTKLKPERASQIGAGATWNSQLNDVLTLLNISVDAYYNKVHDKIVAIPNMYIWKMMNMGEVNIKGLDASLRSDVKLPYKMALQLMGNFSYQDAIDVTNSEAKNYRNQIPYTPKYSGSASATLLNPWVNITYSVIASGRRYALPQNIEENRIDGYAEHTVSVNRQFAVGKTSLFVQGEIVNLTDKNYDIIQYYPMPGRSWRLSVRFNY